MTRSPIPRVLSTFKKHRVKALLMGGQARILYGAAEFSRDIDLCVDSGERNLERLRVALDELGARRVFFPDLKTEELEKGHACHFRCDAAELDGLRIDLMSRMRNAERFARLAARRRVFDLPRVGRIGVVAVEDLVRIKKTQRDKDWPMVRRLVEADISRAGRRAPASRVGFWLGECRTPELLIDIAARYPKLAARVGSRRPAVAAALARQSGLLERELAKEERRERRADRAYWKPLRAELERWRLEHAWSSRPRQD